MISMSNRIASGIAAGFASAVLVAMATPVSAGMLAKQGESTTVTAANGTPLADSSATVAPAKQQRYCFVETITGSRIPHKTCKTKAEWAAEGIDITAK